MDAIIELYGLVNGCPLLSRVDDCPFFNADMLCIKHRVEWVAQLDEKERGNILWHHKLCFKQRNVTLRQNREGK